ncbi:winged helix DNA-binding domain-containing protein [Nocardioidaceae bacterium]|nr:winged helix DNA-binding domain-containing protein [Nocardioidaceae bacterium]
MGSTRTQLSLAEARRVAVAAQGLDRRTRPRPPTPTMRHLGGVLDRTGVWQVDSVNVLARAHLMPLFSRLGPYDTDLLRRAAESRPRRVVEFWAHVQAFMPVELWPVMQHRMRLHRDSPRWHQWLGDHDRVAQQVLSAVREHGPSTARDLDDGAPRSRDHWGWNWSEARRALDYLYLVGDLAIAGRTRQFEPVYDLPERVLPVEVLAAPALGAAEGVRELVRRAARHHGVATLSDLTDFYRLQQVRGQGQQAARDAVQDLVASGELLPVRVETWDRPAWLHRDARVPRAVDAAALLSPFDPLVWHRDRTERLFGFHSRIEIYVPAAHRRWGYYVLPFLLGDTLVARVDLKADRTAGDGALVVHAAYAEPGRAPQEQVADELARELREVARWLGLPRVVVGGRGDLAPALATRLVATSGAEEGSP